MIGMSSTAGMTALIVGAVVLPMILVVAERLNLYDPFGPLKIHRRPIPRLGGVGMALALASGLFVSGAKGGRSTTMFLWAMAMIWVVSLTDDFCGLSPGARLTAQMSAGFVLWLAGWSVPSGGHPILGLVATSLFVAFFVNAFNFLDGSDGLAAGTAAIIALGYLFLLTQSGSNFGEIVAWSVLGTCLGFLVLNFPPADLFMGDSGSAVLGFVVAFLGLEFYRTTPTNSSQQLVPLVLAALPLFDAGFAVLRRLRNQASPFVGDRRHFYDLLLQRGWSPRAVAFLSYVFTAIFVVLASWQSHRSSSLVVTGVFCAAALYAGIRLGLLNVGELWPEAEVDERNATENSHRENNAVPSRIGTASGRPAGALADQKTACASELGEKNGTAL